MDICKPDVARVFNQTHRALKTDIPVCICQWTLITSRRKRRRKRGSRAGLTIRLKAHLQAGFFLNPSPKSCNGGSVAWRPRDLAYRWLRPIIPLCPSLVSIDGIPQIGLCRRRNGVTPGNPRSLRRALFSTDVIFPPKMALINA